MSMSSEFDEEVMKLELTSRLENLSVSDVAMKPQSGKLFIGKSLRGYYHVWR